MYKKEDLEKRYNSKIKKLEETNTGDKPHSGVNSHTGEISHTGESAEGRSIGNGEFVVSTQTMTWIRELKAKEAGILNLQNKNSYDGERHPFGLPDFLESSWHPQPCMLNLKFSHAGEWIKIPQEQRDSTGPDYSLFHIGRLDQDRNSEESNSLWQRC